MIDPIVVFAIGVGMAFVLLALARMALGLRARSGPRAIRHALGVQTALALGIPTTIAVALLGTFPGVVQTLLGTGVLAAWFVAVLVVQDGRYYKIVERRKVS